MSIYNLSNTRLSRHLIGATLIFFGSGIYSSTTLAASLTLSPGWNLVALPAGVSDNDERVATKFDIDGIYSLFAYIDSEWTSYNRTTARGALGEYTINELAGVGLWIKNEINDPIELTFDGATYNTDFSMLQPGWNLIGLGDSVSTINDLNLALPSDMVPTKIFSFRDNIWENYNYDTERGSLGDATLASDEGVWLFTQKILPITSESSESILEYQLDDTQRYASIRTSDPIISASDMQSLTIEMASTAYTISVPVADNPILYISDRDLNETRAYTSIFNNHRFIVADDGITIPEITIADAEVIEGSGDLMFNVTLSEATERDLSLNYRFDAINATADLDYSLSEGSNEGVATISAGGTETTIVISVLDDEEIEESEQLSLTVTDISGFAFFTDNEDGTAAVGTIIDNDNNLVVQALNDTGITWGGSYATGNSTECIGETVTEQDCSFGRDVEVAAGDRQKIGFGDVGFDWTKISATGEELAADATEWFCIRDNVTGLLWESKTADETIHNKDLTYSWGNWQDLVTATNTENLCGRSNWRVPDINELLSIRHLGIKIGAAIDATAFPNNGRYQYWSSTPYIPTDSYYWYVHFSNGADLEYGSFNSLRVRLVSQ